ncbi:MAG TPA: arginine--tRNA ligase [Terriglobales bacterium]|nr:arginine--tRNA ligase [Terriglobales bacterium]
MYRKLQTQLVDHVRDLLRRNYDVDLPNIGVDQPPKVEFGEYALTFCFELAKRLRKPPRKIAEEIIAAMGSVPGFEKFEVAGAGYINARVNRAAMAGALIKGKPASATQPDKVMVEHTSINPNKAAHIGHLRNAIMGDTFVRLLRNAGRQVDVQNYIDNTGVQVADVVVGFVHLENKSKHDVEEIISNPSLRKDQPFDYYCWDLYARVSAWYEDAPPNKAIRLKTLHEIEAGSNEVAEIAEVVSTAVLRRHLETMARLDIRYDFLPRESEILSLHFWDLAFAQLKAKGVLYLETEGKNKGCWVMKRAGSSREEAATGPDEDAKVIVRSNGTVTYVGKDIAYHLWKFGLLGRDFGYNRFFRYPDGQDVWISADQGEAEHPHFGGVSSIYNVIDSRQSDPQNNVVEALRALGYQSQAEHYTHFSYEMVALTPRCALELGYDILEEDRERAYIEVSGRKGFGVKADDLLDALIEAALTEVNARHAQRAQEERSLIAEQIALGALRYFMLKFTKNSVIAFDFKDALSFEGETGPYCQYAVVRASNIFRKGNTTPEAVLADEVDLNRFLAGEENNDLWELWLTAAKLSLTVEQCIANAEPAYLAKYAFQLAQSFNNFYHRHHILHETDEDRKRFLMVTAAVVRRELLAALAVMGIASPEVM